MSGLVKSENVVGTEFRILCGTAKGLFAKPMYLVQNAELLQMLQEVENVLFAASKILRAVDTSFPLDDAYCIFGMLSLSLIKDEIFCECYILIWHAI